MTDRKPLSPEHRRICHLMGLGWEQKRVAEEVGCSTKTVHRVLERDDARELVRRTRTQLFEDAPTAAAVLVAGLSAVKGDGQPDWQSRIAAAKALMSSPVTSPDAEAAAQRATTIYMPEPGDAEGGT